MQNAKDTFYLALRNRLAIVNPSRTMSAAGLQRPGILVEENEVPAGQSPPDIFVLRWTGTAVDTQRPSPVETQTCEIAYWTRGSDVNMDMDRGLLLTAMDADLEAILQPQTTQKLSVAGSADLPMATNVSWTDATFSPVKRDGERLTRSATVTVFSLQESLSDGSVER